MTEHRRRWPEDPDVLPFLPLVLSAWSDGLLTPEEVRGLQAGVRAQGWIPEPARTAVLGWLDPDAPPGAAELAALGDRARGVDVADVAAATRSLTELGLAMARAARATGWEAPGRREELRALERILPVVGTDAARRVLGAGAAPERAPPPPLPFDAPTLRAFLDGDHRALRDEILALLPQAPLHVPPGLPIGQYRARVLDAVRFLADRGFGAVGYPADVGGGDDPSAGVAVFESLAFGDLSVLVKYGVQFGLFGGSILQLGTHRHHQAYLADVASLALPGCYAMTETGHGSNVRDLETTATYDPATDELVVHTPHEDAGKDWIGNAALHGRMATVFARLRVGDEDHGVHAVLVPIRGADGAPLAGVRIEDRGLKEGLNGVDNGRLWFHGVRVPRANLLDRFASIDDEGVYRSDIPSAGRRFFTMLGTLVTGRISIAAASVSAAKTGLTIAVRYAEGRRQFGPEGEAEVSILDYRTLQRSLMPRLATTVGLHFAVRLLGRRVPRAGTAPDPQVEVRAAGLKAYASRHCVETLQACREACGGQGYLAANRLGALKADTDVFTTFEGANSVLLQLVAKGLLSDFRHEMGDMRLWGMVRHLAARAGQTVASLDPVTPRRTDVDHLRDPRFHRDALAFREERLLRSAAQRLKSRLDDGMDGFRAINDVQDHLVALARAHVDGVVLDAFHDGVARAPSPGLSDALETLSALFALGRIEEERAWFLEAGYVEPPKSRAVRNQVNELCREARELAPVLVDAFGIPDAVLAAPAAYSQGS
ncbi:MAG TPA: acyl-CoA dehydrogenase [Longimicrobiales bacterium]|nr:acyl-CoA dehydrogenase [Longimicrobiales bacterium]